LEKKTGTILETRGSNVGTGQTQTILLRRQRSVNRTWALTDVFSKEARPFRAAWSTNETARGETKKRGIRKTKGFEWELVIRLGKISVEQNTRRSKKKKQKQRKKTTLTAGTNEF